VYKYLKGGWKEDRARLFSVVPSARTGGSGHNLKRRRFRLNIRKHVFTVRMTEHWRRLPRKDVEPPSLEEFRSRLDMVLATRSGCPCLSRGLDDKTSRAPFQPQPFWDCYVK